MSDALNSASAGLEVLQRQLNDCTNNVELLQKIVSNRSDASNSLPASITSLMVRNVEMSYLVNFYFRLFSFCSFVIFFVFLCCFFVSFKNYAFHYKSFLHR